MNLLVVGSGAMGRWFARSVRPSFDEIAFVDVDQSAAKDAAAAVGGESIDPDVDRTFDLVCVAVPLPDGPRVIAEYADRAGRAICDVTGSMVEPVEAMRAHCPDAERLSLHPLFAPENAPGTIAVVADAEGPVTDAVCEALSSEENRLASTEPDEHDEAMETVQARAHVAVLAFGLAAADVHEKFQTPISAALFDLVSEVTDGDPRVYSDIQAAFDGADEVADAARALADADPDTFEELYERAR